MFSHLMIVLYFLKVSLCLNLFTLLRENEFLKESLLSNLHNLNTTQITSFDLIGRASVVNILPFKSYARVAILHHEMPADVTVAIFTFKVQELYIKSTFGKCDTNDVYIHIKHASVPVVNPDGVPFPEGFVPAGLREPTHRLVLPADRGVFSYAVMLPSEGSWFTVAYLKYQEGKLQQKSLKAHCHTFLYADLQVQKEFVTLMDCDSKTIVEIQNKPVFIKRLIKDNTTFHSLKIKTDTIRLILVVIQAANDASHKVNLLTCYLRATNLRTVTFKPFSNNWHYIMVDEIYSFGAGISECELSYDWNAKKLRTDVTQLTKDTTGHLLALNFNKQSPLVSIRFNKVNVSNDVLNVMKFVIQPNNDIGGNLVMSFQFIPKIANLTEDIREVLIYKLIICLSLGYASIPSIDGTCHFAGRIRPALLILDEATDLHKINIMPYPESGDWQVSSTLFCFIYNSSVNETKRKMEISPCNGSLEFILTNEPCILGNCSNQGQCMYRVFGSSVVSMCKCQRGYRGWDCGEETRIKNTVLSIVLLTTSNLFFLLPIYIAFRRKYYVECIIYAFIMVFSILYHACDGPPSYTICVLQYELLKFADYLCAVIAIWVTLLRMSIVSQISRNILQVVGNIIIAILSGSRSRITFTVAFPFGVVILVASWVYDYMRTKKLYYVYRYYKLYFPIGVVLTVVGVACFAFLETEGNYMYVHSLWHAAIACSAACLLPLVDDSDVVLH